MCHIGEKPPYVSSERFTLLGYSCQPLSHTFFFAANYKLRCLIKRWGSKIWSQSSALSPTVLHCPLSLLVCHLCTCCPLPVDYLIPMPKRGCDVCLWNRNPLLWKNVLLLDRIMSDLVLFELLRRRAVWPVLFAQCVTPTALAAKVWWLILNNRMHYIRSDRLRFILSPADLIRIISSPRWDSLISPHQTIFFPVCIVDFSSCNIPTALTAIVLLY